MDSLSNNVENTFPGLLTQKLKRWTHKEDPDYSAGDWNFENHPWPQELDTHDPVPNQTGTDTHYGESPHTWTPTGGTTAYPWNDETTYFNNVK